MAFGAFGGGGGQGGGMPAQAGFSALMGRMRGGGFGGAAAPPTRAPSQGMPTPPINGQPAGGGGTGAVDPAGQIFYNTMGLMDPGGTESALTRIAQRRGPGYGG